MVKLSLVSSSDEKGLNLYFPEVVEGAWTAICRLTWVERCLHICSSWIFLQPGMQKFMAPKGRTAKEPDSVPCNRDNCVASWSYTVLCVHPILHQHWREKNHPGKRKRLFHPLLRHLKSKLEIYSVSPLLTPSIFHTCLKQEECQGSS